MLRVLDAWLGWRLSGLGVAGAQALYQTTITLTLSFLVFTFGSLLVAIQIAGGQLTPRIIATTLLRDNVVRYSVGLFVFTLVFAVMALNRLDKTVHEIVSLVTAVLAIACMATFLFLIDYAARLLRPVSILARVGDEGVERHQGGLSRSRRSAAAGSRDSVSSLPDGPTPRRPARRAARRSCSRSISTRWCADAASHRRHHRVRAAGRGLRRDGRAAVRAARRRRRDRRPRAVQSAVAFGPERTLEQDPLFAFRIIVDIALKALSPAINDPTTGVLAIDQMHRLLARGRQAPAARRGRSSTRAGTPRVIFRTPNWEDFVHVACTEIRACGASNVQIARRMRAMLDNLIASLPARRHAALDAERRRLNLAIASLYPIAEDRELASIPDRQGLGGSSALRTPAPRPVIRRCGA